MKKQLKKAKAGSTLRELARTVGPDGLADFLRESTGMALSLDGKSVRPTQVDGNRYAFGESGIEATIELSIAEGLGTVVQKVRLVNTGPATSPIINRIDVVDLPLTVRTKDRIKALSIGGGTTNGFYPTPAYREEIVDFGTPREWEDPEPSFTRWWVAQRFYRVQSGSDSLSSVEKWPVLVTGWDGPQGMLGLWTAMEWSGRYQIELGCENSWQFYLRGGPSVKGMVIAPGETVELPAAHVGFWAGEGLEDGANSVRRQMAQVVSPDVQGKRPWPYAAYHHWFGIEHHITEELAKKQIDVAAELGLEFVEIDAGWYGDATNNFADGVGNWERVDELKFPNGLEPVAEYAKSKGIGFGLWFEPERGRLGSDWLKQHPEFYWSGNGGVNRHLNLTRRDTQDALIEMLSTWISKLDIRWLRWDYNHGSPNQFWDAEDASGKLQFAYFAGLYRVWDTLIERHPNLMIDNCAGGGRRSDFGTLGRSGTMVQSDHAEDAHICRMMQTGGARFLPGNYMNASVYNSERDPEERFSHFEIVSRMAGAISLTGYLSKWSSALRAQVKKLINGFKSYRHLLMKDFHRITPFPRTADDWDVVEFLDTDSGEAVMLAYRVEGPEDSRTLAPVRLNRSVTYRIVDPFTQSELGTASGSELMEKGLQIELGTHDALVRHLIPKA